MPRILPERRTRVDVAVTAVIVIGVLIATFAIWYASPARHTVDAQAVTPPPPVASAPGVPTGFRVAWQAKSAATDIPALARSTVVTADGGTVSGRDPLSGAVLWHYDRTLPLCTAAPAWPDSSNEVLAVYRNSRGCSEVTALDAASGARRSARTSDADQTLRLSTESGYVLAFGPSRLETWGSNLVRGIEYGRISAPVNPGVTPERTGCTLFSGAISGERVAVIEHCTNDRGYRLTVLGAILDSDEKVQQYGSSFITDTTSGPPPRLVAMTASAIAVYDGGSGTPATSTPTLRQFDSNGAPTTSNAVEGMPSAPPDSIALTDDGLVSFFTGRSTVVLDGSTLHPVYQVPGALGPGETMAGQLLLPVAGGISVRDPATGREIRTIAVTREPGQDSAHGHDHAQGTVSLRVLGDHVVEQQGSIITTLAPVH
ncbi:MAG: hypothetical protein QM673_07105 [Gordonia sp. (in: high G+C Gram-positive bacteria)]